MRTIFLQALLGVALTSLAGCAGSSSDRAEYPQGGAQMAPPVSPANVGATPAEAPTAELMASAESSRDEDASPQPDRALSLSVDSASASPGRSLQGMAVGARGAPGAPPPPAPPPITKPVPGLTPGDPAAKSTAAEVAAVRAPLLVYTAQLTLAVFEVGASLTQVEAIGRELGGFLARRDDAAITIRVPAARFDEAVARLEKVGDMLHRNVTAEDVTEEFRDLEVRLKSAHAVQDRLTQLLAKATKVEESVMIERELDRVSGEIDRIEGRMKFLRDRATFSTITVTFTSKAQETVQQGPFRLPSPWLQQLGLGRLLQL